MDDAALFLGSRQVDQFLLGFHDVPSTEHDGYRQRLRNLTRMNFPVGVGSGRGHPARYKADQFFQLVTATELYRCHVPPVQLIKLIYGSWVLMRASILVVWHSVDAREHAKILDLQPMFWCVPAELGQKMIRTGKNSLISEDVKITVINREAADHRIYGEDRYLRRHILIDVNKLILSAFENLRYGTLFLPRDQILCFMSSMDHPS